MKKISQKFAYSLLGIIFLLTSFSFNAKAVLAEASTTPDLSNFWPTEAAKTVLATSTTELSKNLTINKNEPARYSTFGGNLEASFATSSLSSLTDFSVTILAKDTLPLPWQMNLVSEVYQIELTNKSALIDKQQYSVKIRPNNIGNYLQQVFYFDQNKKAWFPLVTKPVYTSKRLEFKTVMPFARVAVFEYPEILTKGKASWYSYKKGMFAASPDFPKGSKLRIYNADKPAKFVDVVVNDFGPDRVRHPERVVDLDKEAFKKLASTGAGTINVIVEPLSIPAVSEKVLGIGKAGLNPEIAPRAKSVAVVNAKTGQVIYVKNEAAVLPIASLTKLVSIKVFLDTRPSLDKVVSYSKQDEKYNFQYADAWSVALLKVKDGETMTIADLLYSALIGSANNAVESLVRVSGLSRPEFILRMNQAAAEWGASSTHFIEPTGLSPQNVSSALDYAIITTNTLNHPIVEKASKMKSYEFYTKNTKKRHYISNTNPLIANNKLKITGSKTGYLDEAQYCLMTRAEDKSGNQVIAVTLGLPTRSQSFDETEELIRYGLNKLTKKL